MRKEDLKKLLVSFTQEDFYKNVDLHIHSKYSDGKLDPVEIVEQAQKKGLKYMAIADHNTIDAYLSTNILKDEMVIPAVEFDCVYKGILIHILGYGIDIDNSDLKTLYSKNHLGCKANIYRLTKLRNPKSVIEKINKAGGIAVLAHPCCYWAFSLEGLVKELTAMGLEGIEVYYPYNGLRSIVKFHSRTKIADIADKYDLIKTGGSDFHGTKLV